MFTKGIEIIYKIPQVAIFFFCDLTLRNAAVIFSGFSPQPPRILLCFFFQMNVRFDVHGTMESNATPNFRRLLIKVHKLRISKSGM